MAKILVIDDDTDYLEEIGQLLKEKGHEATLCSEAVEAPKKLGSGPFDCVLLDFKMPRLDGQDLLSLLRARNPEVPIIICTGYVGGEAANFEREGAFEVLQKPFSPEVLFRTIERAASAEEEPLSVTFKGYGLKAARDLVNRKLIVRSLSKTKFNVTHAAKLLGISRQALLRYMKEFQITR